MATNSMTSRCSPAEIDAAEKVLCQQLRTPRDGYYRSLVEAMLEAAKDVRLQEFAAALMRDIEDPLDRALGEGRR